MGIGAGELANNVSSVMPNPAKASFGVGGVDVTVVVIITLLSMMANARGVCSKEQIGFWRAFCQVIGGYKA